MELTSENALKLFKDEIVPFHNFNTDQLKTFLFFRITINKSLKINNDLFKIIYWEDKLENNSLIINDKLLLDNKKFHKVLSHFFCQNSINAEIYIDIDKKISQIVLKKDVELHTVMDIILATLPKLIPWHFEALPDFILKKCNNILSGNYKFFTDGFESNIRNLPIWNNIMFDELNKVAKNLHDQKQKSIKNQIKSSNDQISSLINQIASITSNIKILEKELAITMMSDDMMSQVNDLIEVFSSYKNEITIIDVKKSFIYLDIRTKMTNFDYEQYELFINNHKSIFYDYVPNTTVNDEDLRQLYINIFETKKISVYFSTKYTIDLHLNKINGYKSSDNNYQNSIPHPHLISNTNLCLGNNGPIIAQLLAKSKMSEVINAIMFSAKQITLGDMMAVNNLIHNIFNYRGLEMPNGEFMNALEAIKYIKEHKEEFDD